MQSDLPWIKLPRGYCKLFGRRATETWRWLEYFVIRACLKAWVSNGDILTVDRLIQDMNKYHINKSLPGERLIEAEHFLIDGEYFWFITKDDQVKAISKSTCIETIDVI